MPHRDALLQEFWHQPRRFSNREARGDANHHEFTAARVMQELIELLHPITELGSLLADFLAASFNISLRRRFPNPQLLREEGPRLPYHVEWHIDFPAKRKSLGNQGCQKAGIFEQAQRVSRWRCVDDNTVEVDCVAESSLGLALLN